MTNVYTADQALSDLQEQFKLLDYKNPEHQKKMQNRWCPEKYAAQT